MAGFANSPLAITPFGSGTPASATEPPDHEPLSALFLNPRSKDNELQSDGSYKRMPRTRHRVLITLLTRRGSMATNRDFGFTLPDKIVDGYERIVRIRINEALAYLVKEGALSIDDVKTEVSGGRVAVTVSYTDLRTGRPDDVTIS